MRRNKKRNKVLLLLLLLLGIGVGFAALATTLKINGTTNVSKPTWSIYWANPVVTNGSVTNTLPDITEDENEPENTKLSWEVDLENPGDYYEFTIDAVNSGNVDAMIIEITPTVTDGVDPVALPNYVKFTVTYDDGTPVELNQLLAGESSQKYKIRVYFDFNEMTIEDINAMPDGGVSYVFGYQVKYSSATNDVVRPELRLGEYFTLVPDAEYATTDIAGFSGSTPTADQTLWRVIKINADGTIDAVADSASSSKITISGIYGYKNYIAGLQDIASKYAKAGYTVKTRCMGYNGQTAVIDDPYYFNGNTTTPPSATTTPSPTTGNGEEYSKGVLGDTLYLRDYQLVYSIYNGSVSAATGGEYWLASRMYNYTNEKNYYFHGRTTGNYLKGVCVRGYYKFSLSSNWYNESPSKSFRPIITLKAGVKRVKNSSIGTADDPYTLQ